MGEQDSGADKATQRPDFPDPKWEKAGLPEPINGDKMDGLMVMDDPMSTRVDTEKPPPIRAGTEKPQPGKVSVGRELGDCGFCEATGLQVIEAFDPRVYEGWACPDCILGGKASEYPTIHKFMNPMVFVARALRGDQPFKDLLKAADLQKENPEAAVRLKKKMATRMAPVKVAGNRKQRRTAEKYANIAARKAAKPKGDG